MVEEKIDEELLTLELSTIMRSKGCNRGAYFSEKNLNVLDDGSLALFHYAHLQDPRSPTHTRL